MDNLGYKIVNISIDVTCAIILNEFGEVLVTQRSERMALPLKWEFPGGKVENGETFEECLIREITEELSLTIKIEKAFGKYHNPKQDITLHPFICSIVCGQITLTEHKDFQWLTKIQLHKLDWAEADIKIAQDFVKI